MYDYYSYFTQLEKRKRSQEIIGEPLEINLHLQVVEDIKNESDPDSDIFDLKMQLLNFKLSLLPPNL